MASFEEAETAVRTYLLALRDGAVQDNSRQAELQKAVKAAKDPIDKLRAVKALRESESADPLQALEDEFVQLASGFAESEGLTSADFKALAETIGIDVPSSVLRRALQGRSGRRTKSESSSTRTRIALPDAEVLAAIDALKGASFKIPELAETLGRDPGIVGLKVKKLVTEKTLVSLGDDPNHSSRGRAPKLYKKASGS